VVIAAARPHLAIFLIVLLGAGLRTAAFASDRSLWLDEAMLALNVVGRSPARLLEPLDRNQGAPVGFLLATKLGVECFGPTERALRLVPFLASLAGLVAFGFAAFRLLPRPSARLALLLFAVSPFVVSYAAECKQYSSDAAIAAGLLAVSAPLFTGGAGIGRWIALGLGGAVAVWCSHPALFVLAGLGMALIAHAVEAKDRARIVGTLAVGAVWPLGFAGVYAVSLCDMGSNGYLLDYWAGHFPPRSGDSAAWLVDHAFEFFRTPGGWGGRLIPASGLAAVLAFLGALAWYREARWPLFAILLPALVVLIASAAHLYPFAGRLLLFLVPAATLLVARGTQVAVGALRERIGWPSYVVPVLLVAASLHEAVVQIRTPSRAEEIRLVLDRVKQAWQTGDRLYVYGGAGDAGAGPAFEFYAPRYGFPAESVIRGEIHRDDPSQYRGEIAKLAPGRIWVLFAHRHRDEETWIRAAFDGIGVRSTVYEAPGAAAYLYRVRE